MLINDSWYSEAEVERWWVLRGRQNRGCVQSAMCSEALWKRSRMNPSNYDGTECLVPSACPQCHQTVRPSRLRIQPSLMLVAVSLPCRVSFLLEFPLTSSSIGLPMPSQPPIHLVLPQIQLQRIQRHRTRDVNPAPQVPANVAPLTGPPLAVTAPVPRCAGKVLH